MSDFKLTQISNVMLGTTDLARSLAFYRDTLGLVVQFEMPGFVFLNAGGVTLSLNTCGAVSENCLKAGAPVGSTSPRAAVTASGAGRLCDEQKFVRSAAPGCIKGPSGASKSEIPGKIRGLIYRRIKVHF